jgi:hypothetical protein
MDYFSIIDGAKAVIVTAGVYRQVDVFERAGYLYAARGNGFVRLLASGKTSDPRTLWRECDVDGGHLVQSGSYIVRGGVVPDALPGVASPVEGITKDVGRFAHEQRRLEAVAKVTEARNKRRADAKSAREGKK